MTAITDLTDVFTVLKGSVPTNQQMLRATNAALANTFREFAPKDGTNEQKAQAVLTGLRKLFQRDLRKVAEEPIYAAVIRQPHLPANQAALLAAVKGTADAAGTAAESDL
jgi:hypothetical protein